MAGQHGASEQDQASMQAHEDIMFELASSNSGAWSSAQSETETPGNNAQIPLRNQALYYPAGVMGNPATGSQPFPSAQRPQISAGDFVVNPFPNMEGAQGMPSNVHSTHGQQYAEPMCNQSWTKIEMDALRKKYTVHHSAVQQTVILNVIEDMEKAGWSRRTEREVMGCIRFMREERDRQKRPTFRDGA